MISKSLRRHVLREWRGLPDGGGPDRTVDAAAAVRKLVERLGLADRVDEEAVLAEWASIVGEFLAAHSKPSRLADGVLVIEVLQPTVRFELERAWKPKIIARLQERFGASAVKDIRFRT